MKWFPTKKQYNSSACNRQQIAKPQLYLTNDVIYTFQLCKHKHAIKLNHCITYPRPQIKKPSMGTLNKYNMNLIVKLSIKLHYHVCQIAEVKESKITYDYNNKAT